MKLTYAEILGLIGAIGKLKENEEIKIPLSVTSKFAIAVKKLTPFQESYNETLTEIREKYCDDEGKIQQDDPNYPKATKALDELDKEEIDLGSDLPLLTDELMDRIEGDVDVSIAINLLPMMKYE